MTNELETFRNHFDDVVEDIQKFAFLARGREFQESSAEAVKTLREEASAQKLAAIEKGEEENANGFLAFEFMAEALECEFRFYVALKDENMHAAWDLLVGAEVSAGNAMKVHSLANHLECYIRRLNALEHLLFPRPVFFSPGFVVRSSECSICGKEYGDCDHIKGRPYMGQICVRIIRDADAEEISVVESPADKRCRALSFTEGDITRDAMTYCEIKPNA